MTRRLRPFLTIVGIIVTTHVVAMRVTAAIPVNWGGYIGYEARHESGDQSPDRLQQIFTYRVGAATYLYRPWIALLNGGLGFSLARTSSDTAPSQDTTIVTGNMDLRLFPRSRFPLHAYYARTDSRVDGEPTITDITTTRFGMIQNVSHKGAQYRFRLERVERDEVRSLTADEEDVTDIVELSASRTLGQHSFQLDSYFNEITRSVTDQEKQRAAFLLMHRYRPSSDLTTETRLNLIRNRDSALSTASRFDTRINQLTSLATWRPKTERPLLVTGNLRLEDSSSGPPDRLRERQSMVATGGATYEWNPQLQLRAAASVITFDSDDDSQLITSQLVGANYTSRTRALGAYQYRWFGSADLRHETDDREADNRVEWNTRLGHRIARSFNLASNRQANISATQTIGTRDNGRDLTTQEATHSITGTLRKRDKGVTTLLRATARDLRVTGDEEREFQLVNLQASREHRLDRYQSLIGNATVQASRDSNSGGTDNDWQTTSSAELTYRHRQLFNVPRLNFTSDLEYISETLNVAVDRFDERESLVWDNRIEYAIGRLFVSANGSVIEANGRQRTLLMFQVQRNFGRL